MINADRSGAAAGVSWAEAKGAGAVYIGIVEEDSSGYPDCKDLAKAFSVNPRGTPCYHPGSRPCREREGRP